MATLFVVLLEILAVLLASPPTILMLVVLPAGAAGGAATEEKSEDGRQVVQSMKVEAPIMTEEDQHGYNMPARYLCDACKAVVYHLNHTLVRRQPRSRRLKEWEYTELFDEICANEFEGYGIKLIGGENVLSGPGLAHREEEVKPGGAMIQMGGDSWKKRMGEVCRRFVYDKVGEEDLYDLFHKKGELSDSMCFEATRDCSLGPKAAPPKKKEDGEKKKKGMEKLISKKGETKKQRKEPGTATGKEEKKTSSKASTPQAAKKVTGGGAGGESRPVDVTYFLAELAVEHGLQPKEYTKNRSKEDWERTMVALAGRIFEKESSSTARARKAEEEAAIEV